MVWLCHAAAGISESGPTAYGSKLRNVSEKQVDSALLTAVMVYRRVELFHCGYTISGEFVDPMFSPEPTRKATCITEVVHSMGTSALWEFVSMLFTSDGALKKERNQGLWNAIFNNSFHQIYEKDRNKVMARYRYTSRNQLLVKHMEIREIMQMAKACVAKDV